VLYGIFDLRSGKTDLCFWVRIAGMALTIARVDKWSEMEYCVWTALSLLWRDVLDAYEFQWLNLKREARGCFGWISFTFVDSPNIIESNRLNCIWILWSKCATTRLKDVQAILETKIFQKAAGADVTGDSFSCMWFNGFLVCFWRQILYRWPRRWILQNITLMLVADTSWWPFLVLWKSALGEPIF